MSNKMDSMYSLTFVIWMVTIMDFGPSYFIVLRIDGDYAILLSEEQKVEHQVARALLPGEIEEGTRLKRELFSYSIV